MSPMRRPALWVVLFLCAWLALPAAQTRTAQKHFMWAVRHEGAPATYLVGSLHVLTPDFYPLAPAIEQAFKDARRAILESGPLGMMAVEAIIIENQPVETLRGDLRLALNRLAVLWKMQQAA